MKPPLVLVVDDDTDVCEIIALALRDQFRVVTLHNGREAIEQFDEIDPDVAIVDLVLPGMDGLTLCERIREADPDVIIIIVTATTKDSEVPDSVWRIGTPADAFLSKPFDPSELRNLIQKLRAEAEQSRPG